MVMVLDMDLHMGAIDKTFTAVHAHIVLVKFNNMHLQSGLINKCMYAYLTSEIVIGVEVGIQL